MNSRNLSSGTRIVVSFLVLIIVVALVEPHTMDVKPPLYVKVLLAPAIVLAPFVGKFLPHGNIGSAEHPIIEGTPLDLMTGQLLIFFSIFLYPVIAYLLLSILYRCLKAK
jgi:hypothetical protein